MRHSGRWTRRQRRLDCKFLWSGSRSRRWMASRMQSLRQSLWVVRMQKLRRSLPTSAPWLTRVKLTHVNRTTGTRLERNYSLDESVWRWWDLCERTNVPVFRALVLTVLLYFCETRTLTRRTKTKIELLFVLCYFAECLGTCGSKICWITWSSGRPGCGKSLA